MALTPTTPGDHADDREVVIEVSPNGSSSIEPRDTVVVVGSASRMRTNLSSTLIDDGHSVVLCAGPPACPLLRSERCVLVEVADAVVILPNGSTRGEVREGLASCARAAGCAVVVEPSVTVAWPPKSIRVGADDLDGVTRGLRAVGP